MNEPIRPDLARISSTMAANQARTARSIAALADQIDRLVTATARKDWPGVASLSQQIIRDSRRWGYRGVSALAKTVYDEAARPDNELEVKRSLIRLIGTYGRSSLA